MTDEMMNLRPRGDDPVKAMGMSGVSKSRVSRLRSTRILRCVRLSYIPCHRMWRDGPAT